MRNLKKKAALLLALVMMVSLIPFNVFGRGISAPTTTWVGGPFQYRVEIDMNQFQGMTATSANAIHVLVDLGGANADNLNFAAEVGAVIDSGTASAGPSGAVVTGFNWTLRVTARQQALLTIIHEDGLSVPLSGVNQVLPFNFNLNITQWAPDAHVTVTNVATGNVFSNLNERRLANFPAPGVNFSTGDVVTFNEVLRVPDVRIDERSAGQFLARASYLNINERPDQLLIVLEAPPFYTWQQQLLGAPAPTVRERTGLGPRIARGGSGHEGRGYSFPQQTNEFGWGTRLLHVLVPLNTDTAGSAGLAGGLVIQNLVLVPNWNAPSTGWVGLDRIDVGNRWSDNWVTYGVHVGNRSTDALGAGQITMTRTNENIANVRTGDQRPGHEWDVTLRFEESIRGAWDAGVELGRLNIELPRGVHVDAAQVRIGDRAGGSAIPGNWDTAAARRYDVRTAALNPGAVFANATGILGTQTGMNSDRNQVHLVLPRHEGAVGVGQPRVVDVRLRLTVRPGFEVIEGQDIYATVGGTAANRVIGDRSVKVANAIDPVSITLDGPLATVQTTDHLGLVSVASVQNIVITEAATGRLRAGSHIDISLPSTPGLVAPQIGNLTIEASGVSAWENTWTTLPGNVVRIEIGGQSHHEPGEIRIGLSISGTLIDAENFNYDLRFGGTAINSFGASGERFANNFYVLSVLDFGTQELPDIIGPGPGDEGPVNEVPSVSAAANAVNSQGIAIFETVNGQQWVNLRGLMEILEDGTVGWSAETGAVFSAPHATNGTITSIWEYPAGVFSAEVNNQGGTRGARFENINNSWYVSVDAFQTLFGIVPVIG